jgi:hypothetical protein
MIRAANSLARLAGRLAAFFEEAERRLARCPDCGRSAYYGAPCKGR